MQASGSGSKSRAHGKSIWLHAIPRAMIHTISLGFQLWLFFLGGRKTLRVVSDMTKLIGKLAYDCVGTPQASLLKQCQYDLKHRTKYLED